MAQEPIDRISSIDTKFELIAFIFYMVVLLAVTCFGAYLSAFQGFDNAMWVGGTIVLGVKVMDFKKAGGLAALASSSSRFKL